MKKIALKMSVSLLMMILFLSLATAAYAASKPSVKNIKTGKKTLYEGNTFTLKVNKKVATLKFSSDNKTVAVISSKGKITAKKKGTATIIIKDKTSDKKAEFILTVKNNNDKCKAMEKELFESLDTANTNNTDEKSYSFIMVKEHLDYLNVVADQWVQGEISEKTAKARMVTKRFRDIFENYENGIEKDKINIVTHKGKDLKELYKNYVYNDEGNAGVHYLFIKIKYIVEKKIYKVYIVNSSIEHYYIKP